MINRYRTNQFVNKMIVENIILLNKSHIQIPFKNLTLTLLFWHKAIKNIECTWPMVLFKGEGQTFLYEFRGLQVF